MNKNDIFEIEITGLTDEGMGVGRAEGMAVFVPYALPGEKVRVIIIKVMKSYAAGKLLDIIKPSEQRTKSECKYFYKCGGCQFQNVSYDAELEYKRQKVEDCIRRIGHIDTEVLPVLGAAECRYYRNKGQFPVSPDGIGLYASRSHRVIDMDGCIIQDRANPDVLKCIREWMKDCGVPAYDEKTGKGTVRHIYTRSGDSGLMVCVVTAAEKLPYADVLVQRLRTEINSVSGVLQNINKDKTNVVLGRTTKLLWGKDYIVDSIGSCRFKISPQSFYQVNNAQTKVLYDKAVELAGLTGRETVWDLYCGIGTIGQYAAKGAARIVGVEIVEMAVANAKENAELNGIKNAQYFCGASEKLAPELIKKGLKPDVIFLDPPRKGCDAELLKTAATVGAKRIVYISCKPSTLARDLKVLNELGYAAKIIQPVDLFPRTAHVETVVLLSRLRPDDGIEAGLAGD